MIIPSHSRDVKVITRAEFSKIENLIGSLTYETSQYCVYLDETSENVIGVYKLISEREKEPFIRIKTVEDIDPNATKRLIHDPSLDLSNTLEILCRLKKYGAGIDGPEIIIFASKHDHMTFTYCDAPLNLPEIQVVDVIPPSPSKLQIAFQTMQNVGMIPKDYPIRYNLINEVDLLEQLRADPVLIPCWFSEIMENSPRKIFSVDKNLHRLKNSKVHVVGCQRTREAAEAYGIEISEFKDMCPQQNLPKDGIFIAKCCLIRSKVEQHAERNAKGVIVPWGFNYAHIFQAGIILQDIILKSLSNKN
ncbi:MAG: hypothetical protein ACE5I5_05525 [Candidatus Heimdallarchaeota archaeon]